MLKLVNRLSYPNLFDVYAFRVRSDPAALIETVGALDPSVSPENKLVYVISTQIGCAIGCLTCDASRKYGGNLTSSELLEQVAFLTENWAGLAANDCRKLKIQFARMGEPSLNDNVLEALELLPSTLKSPGLMPCIATVAPLGRDVWFEKLRETKQRLYSRGRFQLQFSVQTTNLASRARIIPANIWNFSQIADYATRFVEREDRKVVLNFALALGVEVDPGVVATHFCPESCLVKLTPLNPTATAAKAGLRTAFAPDLPMAGHELARKFGEYGFDCIVSMGLPVESEMKTSCGQLALISSANQASSPLAEEPIAL
jgi:23S rRNA (adenine2503-C2)-methyltransferase